MSELQGPARPSADYMPISGTEEALVYRLMKVYRAKLLPTLLYACETWTVYQRHAKKLNHFHTTCLRKLLNIKWQDRIPDTEVLAQADLPSIYTILMQSQLRWAGHVARMPDSQKGSSMANYSKESGPMEARRSASKTL